MDKPYDVLPLQPDEFQVVYEEIEDSLEHTERDNPRWDTLVRVLEKLRVADQEHVCVDETPQSDTEAKTVEVPLCAVHGIPMVWQSGKRGYFWSCHQKTEGKWCTYRPTKAEEE